MRTESARSRKDESQKPHYIIIAAAKQVVRSRERLGNTLHFLKKVILKVLWLYLINMGIL